MNYFLVVTQGNVLDEVDKHLEKHNLPKLTSEETENLKRPIPYKEKGILKTSS